MRTDANRIGLRVVRNVLDAAAPFEVAVGTLRVACVPAARGQEEWRPDGLLGLDPALDGSWPKSITFDCKWPDGGCRLVAEAGYWRSKDRYRHFVALRVRTERNQELVWVTVPTSIDDTPDGSRFTLQGRVSIPRKRDPDVGARVSTALREMLATSGLPLASESSAVLCEADVPSGQILPAPSVALQRLLHLALLKLDFIDAGDSATQRGRPLVDLKRWDLTSEALAKQDDDDERGRSTRPPTKRELLEKLRRDELQRLIEQFDVAAEDKRANKAMVDALVRAKRVRLGEFLLGLTRERLKELCGEFELDDMARDKATLVERLTGEEATDQEIETEDAEPEGDAAQLLGELLSSTLTVAEKGTGWPLRGSFHLDGRSHEVDIYVRMVGGSSRGNALERRFQNPSQKSPIVDAPGRSELLFGVWNEQGTERTVFVAFDAYRRLARSTRFSMFMPLSLLEQAADTGFASHENTRGETLYAFRPDNIGRYFQSFLQGELGRVEQPTVRSTRRQEAAEAATKERQDAIQIRPKVGMYSAFARLNYKPWFALAEFIDNSVQSFLQNRERLSNAGHAGPLVLDVGIDENEITVTDRAGGIAWIDFPRAFSPATPPDDASGLSEFGLGMKAAACWFARRWSVRTSALGEPIERTVVFDIPKITKAGTEELPIESRPAKESDHFTVISLTDLRVQPKGRTLTKIRDHLASIYRVLLSEGVIRIRLTTGTRSEELAYSQPEILEAPYYARPNDPSVKWRTEFAVDFEDRKVRGWAAIMNTGSHQRAGFSIFRRKRLIDGSVGETYKPQQIFGSPNSFASQRIVGELFVDGFDVSHTKDGVQWHGYEDELVTAIARELNTPKRPLIDQANGYRARTRAAALKANFGEEALAEAASALSRTEIPPLASAEETAVLEAPPSSVMQRKDVVVRLQRDGAPIDVHLKLVHDVAAPFYAVKTIEADGKELLSIEINLDHEFSVSFINDDEATLQPLLRFIAALGLAERLARQGGVKSAGTVRSNTNTLLLNMSKSERQ